MDNPDALKSLLSGVLSFAPEWGALLVLVFLFLILGCYIKLVTVLSIVRVGFGFSSVPAAFAVSGLAIVMSCVVMGPLISKTLPDLYAASKESGNPERRSDALERAVTPWKAFLRDNAEREEITRFLEIERKAQQRQQTGAAAPAPVVAGGMPASSTDARQDSAASLGVLGSAFIITELKEAFATGLHLLLPFLVIELVVAALLGSLGFWAMNPGYVALPFKLLVFVLADGWTLVSTNLLSSYVR